MIDDFEKSGERRAMKIKFISPADSGEYVRCFIRVTTAIMIGNDTDEVIQQIFDSILHKHQIGLQQFIKVSNFIMSKEYIIYATKKNLNCGGSNISPILRERLKARKNEPGR